MAGRSPFTEEFKVAHAALDAGGFAAGWDTVAVELAKLSDDGGPHDSHAAALEALRKAAGKIAKGSKIGEQENLLTATGEYDLAKGTLSTPFSLTARNRAAALKVLRHLSLLRRRGGQQVWILSLANGFTDWPSVAFAGADVAGLKSLLGDTSEPFSKSDKKHLGEASQEAMKWVQKTLIVLAAAAGTDKKATAAQALVSRWFADTGSKPADIAAAVATLSAGFKKIQGVLGSGKLLLTDHPEVRHATAGDNAGFWRSEAFVKGAREGMDVVYIESAFFSKKGSNTLSGLKNWARILVHELSHREVGTVDKFYSWQGMKPDAAGFPMADALVNADSWAFFCVDAAGALTSSERNTALS